MCKEIIFQRKGDKTDPLVLLKQDKEEMFQFSHAWYNEICRFIRYVESADKPLSQAILDEIDEFRNNLP